MGLAVLTRFDPVFGVDYGPGLRVQLHGAQSAWDAHFLDVLPLLNGGSTSAASNPSTWDAGSAVADVFFAGE